jgi:hypothetical protein
VRFLGAGVFGFLLALGFTVSERTVSSRDFQRLQLLGGWSDGETREIPE